MKIEPRNQTDLETLKKLISQFVIKNNPYKYLDIVLGHWKFEYLQRSDTYYIRYKTNIEGYKGKSYNYTSLHFTPISNTFNNLTQIYPGIIPKPLENAGEDDLFKLDSEF